MDNYLSDVEAALSDLGQGDIVARIWRREHTVWKPEPTEITNRLGWLTVADQMSRQMPALQSFAQEIIEAGFRQVVLLGMGGSSLGAEVLRQTFGSAAGYPEIIVLDSTMPAWVQSVTQATDPARTLFLVSSKSGTTTEPLCLYRYFRNLVEIAIGKDKAGGSFVTITDPGTPLARLATRERFRRIFLNPPDIGGRYSVLSYFGLVPAALAGINITRLLEQADGMREACAPGVPIRDNPGAWLGAYLATLALKGRDKLTVITSPAISSFGLWLEQLIAESTGKEGKGIIPVVGEPLVEADYYGDDRFFVFLRLEDDNNSGIDTAIERIRSWAQPMQVLELKDRYDLGAEFYRWQFATAIAGAMLGINPFDQPNVQQTKDATERLLGEYITAGNLPQIETPSSFSELLTKVEKGRYLAIMAYLKKTAGVDRALAELRRRVVEKYGIATTVGYGPRFLHSTGQLHKGGPATGLFLQITADHEQQIPIPGKAYTFGVVADAQALGDLQTLQSLGRSAVRVHFRRGDQASILKLVKELK